MPVETRTYARASTPGECDAYILVAVQRPCGHAVAYRMHARFNVTPRKCPKSVFYSGKANFRVFFDRSVLRISRSTVRLPPDKHDRTVFDTCGLRYGKPPQKWRRWWGCVEQPVTTIYHPCATKTARSMIVNYNIGENRTYFIFSSNRPRSYVV